MASFLSKDMQKELKCKKCTNCLSVPPITITPNGYSCGRCKIAGLRATAFESLAKVMLFPCKNTACPKQLSFDETFEHEISCEYTEAQCPFCTKKFTKTTISEHFREDHAEFLISGDFSFPKGRVVESRRWMAFGEDIYIIQMGGMPDKFFLALVSTSDPKDVFYDFTIKSESRKIVLCRRKAIPFDDMEEFSASDEDMLCHEHIRSVLNSSEYVFEVKILTELQLPEEFRCTICHEFVKPEHSSCSNCRTKISQCPSWKGRNPCPRPLQGQGFGPQP